jgi:hypothetical protein
VAYPFRRCCDTPASDHSSHLRGCINYRSNARDRAIDGAADLQRHNLETIPGFQARATYGDC